MDTYYHFDARISATACRQMDNATVKKLWKSVCLGDGVLSMEPTDEYIFRLGETAPPQLPPEAEYAFRIDEGGIFLVGRDYGGLMRGFFSLLLKIEYESTGFKLRCGSEEGRYRVKNRMLHICIFPENDLLFIQKLIRYSALCQYTHIVIEFWGMLRYDCLKELAWPNAFTKEEVSSLIRECRDLGIEPIPMFNQLGHAAASRACYGKNVLLDQNPHLFHLLTPDGWVWNIQSRETEALLKSVRAELYELFGKGEYMHIGCDEADYITHNPALRQQLPAYLARLTTAVEKEGRRPMMWMDMLLEQGRFESCFASSNAEEAPALRRCVADSTVFVDWQYECRTAPIPSLVFLQSSGHDCIGAPWFNPSNYAAHIDTVAENALFGIMLTTWDALKIHMHSILDCAEKCGAHLFPWNAGSLTKAATVLRLVSFEKNAYPDCGWAKKQIEV